ncbi:unnamed protein product, partial [Gulo gulo]
RAPSEAGPGREQPPPGRRPRRSPGVWHSQEEPAGRGLLRDSLCSARGAPVRVRGAFPAAPPSPPPQEKRAPGTTSAVSSRLDFEINRDLGGRRRQSDRQTGVALLCESIGDRYRGRACWRRTTFWGCARTPSAGAERGYGSYTTHFWHFSGPL